ncbi:hypothetical protein BV22DRAFT_1135009 [Leucogyrophana mollusca]|uniref:Uncharacterized protein n=1 Tax=Leucogyrophana mollusca TaxID=85980 RepID=A0ACB8AXD9_9AGAM|nr:hypothetical protein BV22DRAFT_1135009 [Leucogyrophana mollusca]
MFSAKFIAAALVLSSTFYSTDGAIIRRDDGDKSSQVSQTTQTSATTQGTQTTQSTMSTKSSESSHVSPTQSTWSSHTTGTQTTQSSGSTQSTQSSPWSHSPEATGSSHPTQSSYSPKPTGSGGNCNGIMSWQPNTAYTAGNQTVYVNELWTAKQWSYNNPPKDAAMEWAPNGPCSDSSNVSVSCSGIAVWDRSTQYEGGSKVTYNSHLWFAPHWASSNTPGDKSGAWVDQGTCTSN